MRINDSGGGGGRNRGIGGAAASAARAASIAATKKKKTERNGDESRFEKPKRAPVDITPKSSSTASKTTEARASSKKSSKTQEKTQEKYTQEQADRFRADAEAAIAEFRAGAAPYDQGWEEFRPDPAWPLPPLPEGLRP